MAEYIDRAELMKFPIRIGHYDKEHGNVNFVYGVETVLEYAEYIPAADVAPVVHGWWVKGVIEREPVIKNGRVYRNDTQTFQCSECKETFAGITYGFNYCPNCGARMDGEG